jgi:CBS domain containing-hemolysin-like protein
MTPALAFTALLLAAILCLCSYIVRLESQFGRILARDIQQHLEAWEQFVEPRLGMSREHVTLAATAWMHLSMAIEAIIFANLLFLHSSSWNGDAVVQWLVLIVLTVVLCGEVFPSLILQRMPGKWLASVAWLVRILLALMLPVTLVITFLLSIATLTESAVESPHEDEAGDVEALLEAGEEEGILEEEDRQLVRSALQFGDKLVKEVMTPRSAIFAVPSSMLLRDFLQALRQHNYSRVPVYRDALDSVTGIAFAHDLLYLSDADIAQRTV